MGYLRREAEKLMRRGKYEEIKQSVENAYYPVQNEGSEFIPDLHNELFHPFASPLLVYPMSDQR
jgi:hypothetical protein